jgi:hypothetical protein
VLIAAVRLLSSIRASCSVRGALAVLFSHPFGSQAISLWENPLMWLRLVSFFAATLAVGCGRSDVGQTFPVRGVITFDGARFTAKSATILLKPDVSLGNRSMFEPVGIVDDAGEYQITTQGISGAPPGWYKVIVTAYADPPEHPRSPKGGRPVVTSLLPAIYGRAESTPLAIEVVADPAPGAYDLKLSQ